MKSILRTFLSILLGDDVIRKAREIFDDGLQADEAASLLVLSFMVLKSLARFVPEKDLPDQISIPTILTGDSLVKLAKEAGLRVDENTGVIYVK